MPAAPQPPRNHALELAWEYAEHTSVSMFLTGKAGTGKTTFLHTLRSKSAKTLAVVAPTGVAAINAAGVTIHSFFQLPLSPYVPGSEVKEKFSFSKEKLRIIRALDMLVIDEISMVRADLLDAVDNALRKYRRDGRPFGGVQLLMIGDLRQLPPVVTPQDEALLRAHYNTPYFFGSHALARINYVTIELTTVYRQQNPTFVSMLNAVRDNRMTPEIIDRLNSRLDPDFRPPAEGDYIRLTTHNATANYYNDTELNRLTTAPRTYKAKVTGTFPELSYPTAEELTLKVGAQVMFVKNDPTAEHRYYNGKVGRVVALAQDSVTVHCPGDADNIVVGRLEWENAKYTINEKTNTVETDVQGVFSQIPLRLAWAITIHKSQGLTFEHVVIDAGRSFAPGQVYVALSRCKTLEGIVLATPISPGIVSTDPNVSRYIDIHADDARRSATELDQVKLLYHRQLLAELFSFAEVATLQHSLARQITTVYRVAFPQQNAQQQQLSLDLREKIIEVADKWLVVINNTAPEALFAPAFLERVRRSAEYFLNTMESLFGDSLQQAAKVRSDNQKATQRVKELVGELSQAMHIKANLLEYIATKGFSVAGYLKHKQEAVIKGSRTGAAAAKPAKAPKPAKKAADEKETTSAFNRAAFFAALARRKKQQ